MRMYVKRITIPLLLVLLFGIPSIPIFALDNPYNIDGYMTCPLSPDFVTGELVPRDDTNLLTCRHYDGSIYYAEMGDVFVNDDDLNWNKSEYPTAWVCSSYELEDCKYY